MQWMVREVTARSLLESAYLCGQAQYFDPLRHMLIAGLIKHREVTTASHWTLD